MSNDLRNIKPESRDLLLNKRVIAINQDKLGIQGQRLYKVRVEVFLSVLCLFLSVTLHPETILTSLAFRDSGCIRWELRCFCVCFCLYDTLCHQPAQAFRDSGCIMIKTKSIRWELMCFCPCLFCVCLPSTKTSLAFKDSDSLRWELMYFCLSWVCFCLSLCTITILTSLAFRDSDCIRWELMYFCVCVCFCLSVTVPSTSTNLAFRVSDGIKWKLMHFCVSFCVSFSLMLDAVSVSGSVSLWCWLCVSFFFLALDSLHQFLGLFLLGVGCSVSGSVSGVELSASFSGSVSLWMLWVCFSLVLDSLHQFLWVCPFPCQFLFLYIIVSPVQPTGPNQFTGNLKISLLHT